ncbi:MAG: hypothetical protein R3D67_02580 [Hyphomicrobiaceae bacterium]
MKAMGKPRAPCVVPRRARMAWAIGALWATIGAIPVHAATLPAEACEKIRAEHAQLESAGMVETLKKGPDWAKANLTPAKLKEVERYIGLEEQLLFKCGLALARGMPGTEAEDDEANSSTEQALVPPPLPKRKPAQQATAAPSPAPKSPATKPGTKAKTQQKSATKKSATKKSAPAKPQRKVDDAFRPPPRAPAAPSP